MKGRARSTGGNDHNQARAEEDLFLKNVPADLQLKVLALLPHRERARLVVLNKAWRKMILGSWTSFDCEFSAAGESKLYVKWLKLLAKRGHSRQSLQNLQLLQCEGHRSNGATRVTIDRQTPLVRFENLRTLTLCKVSSPPARWPTYRCTGLVATNRFIQDLTALRRLEELSVNYRPFSKPRQKADTVTLREFAGLPTLCKLAIKLDATTRDALEGLTLDLAPTFTDLTRLLDFAIHDLSRVNVNMALRSMVGRLESLSISLEQRMHEVLHAPHMTNLEFWDFNFTVPSEPVLPFQTSDRLKNLSFSKKNIMPTALPLSILSQGQSLTRLRLEAASSSLADLQQLRNLTNLSELHVDSFLLNREANMQHFAMLARLERLEISSIGHNDVAVEDVSSPPTVLFAGQIWESLRIFKVQCYKYGVFVLSLDSLPALEELQGIRVPWEGTVGGSALPLQQHQLLPQNLNFSRLPQLHSLDMVANFSQPEGGLTQALQQLTSLRELSLAKGLSPPDFYEQESPKLNRQVSERTNFIEVVLRALASAQALKILKLVSFSDCLQLSRELIPPSARHLSLACYQMDVHANCMPWKEESVDLHFSQPMHSTLERLTMCQDLKLTSRSYDDWNYFNCHKAGQLCHDLEEVGKRFKFESAAEIIQESNSYNQGPYNPLRILCGNSM